MHVNRFPILRSRTPSGARSTAGCSLITSLAAVSVRTGVATVPRRMQGISMSPGRPPLKRYPDRGGPVHQQRRDIPMRKASSCLAVLGLAVLALALPGVAAATPPVTFKAQAVPIPGFPHTGNIFGAGAAVEAEYTTSGPEYGGFRPPLIHVNFYLPAGTKLHPSGVPTCNPPVLDPA